MVSPDCFAAVVVMSIITVGREFFLWPISGHISTVTAVAIIQVCDVRLSRPLRWAYLPPLLIVVAMRLLTFDGGLAAPVWSALAAGTLIGVGTVAAERRPVCSRRCQTRVMCPPEIGTPAGVIRFVHGTPVTQE